MLDAQVGIAGGGTLISSVHIITAGNLIHNYVEWRCRLGSQLLIQTRQIVSIVAITHPDYAPNPRQNDIGIITLPANSILSFSGLFMCLTVQKMIFDMKMFIFVHSRYSPNRFATTEYSTALTATK